MNDQNKVCDINELRQQIEQKALSNYKTLEDLKNYLKYTMSNFAYRYIQSDFSGDVEIIEENDKIISASAKDNRMVDCLKVSNKAAKQGIMELARKIPKKDSPTVFYQISCKILEFDEGFEGSVLISAKINWNFPTHDSNKTDEVKKEVKYSFDDPLDMRNILPKHFEDVCEIFS